MCFSLVLNIFNEVIDYIVSLTLNFYDTEGFTGKIVRNSNSRRKKDE